MLGSVWLKDTPGALASASSALAKAGVNLTGSSSVDLDGGKAEWGFFGELEDQDMDAAKLESVLKGVEAVTRCKIRISTEGIIVDDLHYPLRLTSGQQAMVLERKVFADMLKHMKDVFGTGGATIAFELGKQVGKANGEELVREFGKDNVLSHPEELVMLYMAQGWGKPELAELDNEKLSATLRIYDNFECTGQKSDTCNSHFIKGHLQGLNKVLWGVEVAVTEVKCVARGDPYCEFYGTRTGA